jgi:hypothetical protein
MRGFTTIMSANFRHLVVYQPGVPHPVSTTLADFQKLSDSGFKFVCYISEWQNGSTQNGYETKTRVALFEKRVDSYVVPGVGSR